MEQLNRIEIRGNVGNVNILKVGNTRVAHFSVATNFAYKDRNGEPVIETTCYSNRKIITSTLLKLPITVNDGQLFCFFSFDNDYTRLFKYSFSLLFLSHDLTFGSVKPTSA